MAAELKDDVFFLPFDSDKYTSYSLNGELDATPDKEGMPHCFDTLQVAVSVPPSATGRFPTRNFRYLIKVDEYILIRPPTNAHAPSVGRVVALFSTTPRARNPRVRVQWFYKAQDYLEKLPVPPGEDEVLETPHFNDIDADSVVGRCTVSARPEYFRLVERAPVNSMAAPILEDAPDSVRFSYPRGKGVEESLNGTRNGDLHGSDGGNGDNGDNGDDDDDDDDSSVFGDNYSSASTRYYCREFYNAYNNKTCLSRFEDSDADPMQDIADGEVSESAGSEEAQFSDESSDCEVSDDGDVDGGDVLHGLPRKRRLRNLANHTKRREPSHRDEKSSQFCLPDIDIGESLPCRDAEKEKVTAFLKKAIEHSAQKLHDSGRCMYISGVPGTGKTATVREVLAKLRILLRDGRVPPFEVIEVNGMALSDVSAIFSELYSAVVGRRGVSAARAQHLLRERFESSDERRARAGGGPGGRSKNVAGVGSIAGSGHALEQGKCVILLLDEMDVLVNRNQEVVHTLLEWAARPNSRLALVGIANTMDLPERLLAKSKSRMGNDRLVYSPYKKDQLLEILALRLKSSKLPFQKNAKDLVASKIASLSGDVRRALELCRRATEVAIKAGAKAVTIQHVSNATVDMTGGARLRIVAERPLNDRLALVAVLALSRSHGAFDIDSTSSVGAIFRRCRDIAGRHPKIFPWGLPETEELDKAVSNLVGLRIVLVERDTKPYDSRLVVNLSPEDILFALKDDQIALSELHH